MRLALVHAHVLEDLASIGVKAESYDSYAGYEHRYARLLNQRGYDVDLVIFSRHVDDVRHMRHVWGHDIVFVPLRGRRFLRQVKLFRRLLNLVKRYDVVHCFSYYSNVYDVLAFSCFFSGVPLVAQAQGIYPNIPLLPRMRKMLTLRLAERLMPLNNKEAEFLRSRFRIAGSRVVVVPNFVVPEDHVPMNKAAARRMVGVDDDKFMVLTVCRLVPEKGVQTLLQAMALLKDDAPDMCVVVVGEGPYRNHLEKLASELDLTNRVQFVGYVPNQQIGRYFSAADCFVLASLEETFPFALLEAMVYGLPVVSSRTWGPSEIVVEGETGLLFNPGDAEALAHAIKRLYRDPEMMCRMGEAGRLRVLENYTQNTTFSLLKKVYEGLRR
ncbi:MAG: glycosyltransferase family 4 protein [Candidatus Caldarchaeum sp.]|nr:glycosyltransferase family 4 protein [Candidatus Caldarchaeum sp.]